MTYLGSKAASGVFQKIIAEMPPHDTYIETHLGGGAVMLHKPPARRNWGIDIDPLAVEAFCQGNVDFLDTVGDSLFIDVADAVQFLRGFDFSSAGRVLVYADPPYLHETRTSAARYDELLTGWRQKEFQAMTRGGVRTEKIWMNYPEGRAYSHTFAGKDYNDRERIKRKAKRWREKFAALPHAERLAIMTALSEVND